MIHDDGIMRRARVELPTCKSRVLGRAMEYMKTAARFGGSSTGSDSLKFLEAFYSDVFRVAGTSWPRFVGLMDELATR